MSADLIKIKPYEARERVEAMPPALLVCAYDDEEKFRQNHLEGAMALSDLQARESTLKKDTEIIFYCA